MKKEIIGKVNRHFGKALDEATPNMIYTACALLARDKIMEKWSTSHKYVKEHGNKKLLNIFRLWLPASMIPVFVDLLNIDTEKECNQVSSKERKQILYLLKV